LGVKINPTGPQYVPVLPNATEQIYGGFGLLSIAPEARYYSATATFKQPIDSVTMTVENVDRGDYKNEFTLVAFDEGHRIERKTIRLGPSGSRTVISLTAPTIDKVKWSGDGWTFHPYIVTQMNVTFAPAAQPIDPVVSSAAPEPGFIMVAGPLGIFLLLQRRRKQWTAAQWTVDSGQ
jgi:hypothetical protein